MVDERDLRETYLPHFEAAIREGGAYSVMCAYNSVDGQPACANTRLLSDILRKEWGFKGYVVSDCGAIGDIYLNHKFSPNPNEGVAKAIKAGTDLNCGVEYGNLLSAVRAGLLKESEIDQSLKRLLVARFKLGMFDPPAMVKYARIPYSENDSPARRTLAIETARKSIVLLKNQNHLLPLAKTIKTIAVIGPNADDAATQLGNYNGIPAAPVTALEGIRRKVSPGTRVIYARGSDVAANMPAFEPIPASALLTSADGNRRSGLNAEYFNTANFDGKAHRPAELTYPNSGKMVGAIPPNPKPLFTRVDPNIDFHWGDGAPRPGMNDDDFGVRWTGYLSAPVTGTYQLGAIGMNAWELSLDGKQVARTNSIHGYNYEYAPVELQAGKLFKIALDYHEFVNDASIQLVWSPPRATRQIDEAIAAAKQADVVVMVLGLSPRLEGEEMKVPVAGFSGGDRLTLDIPAVQEELLEKVTAVGKPVVLVLMNGSAVAINWAHDHVPAIVEGWYPGQAGGTAIADALFGDYNPAGRLPVTFYKSVDQLPAFTDYSMKNRTYRFFTGQPLYPFGYGLSYTSFGYRNLTIAPGKQVRVSVEVENTGGRDGDEVVQLYVTAPVRALAGFRRIALKSKERRTVEFTLLPTQLRGAGSYEISIGGGQPGYLATGVVPGSFRVPQP